MPQEDTREQADFELENKTRSLPAEPPERFIDDYLPYLMARASFLVSDQFHNQLAKRGISVPFWRVLTSLSDSGGLSIGDLAKIVLYKQPTLTKVIDRMIEVGLVDRIHSRKDRRRVLVTLTDEGHRRFNQLLPLTKANELEILSSYTAQEEATLKHVLRTLINRLG